MVATAEPTASLTAFLSRYGPGAGETGPERLVADVFGVVPDAWQRDCLLRPVANGERQISAMTCHGPGKTAGLSWLIWTYLLSRFPQKTVATAPSGGQMEDALLAEVKLWYGRLPTVLQELYDVKADRIALRQSPADSFASFRTARPETPEILAGIHREDGFVLLIVDEASGVAEPIFESGLGSMSGWNCATVLAGNPVRTGGFFHNTHFGDGATRWRRVHVAGCAHPDVGPASYISDRVNPEFVQMVQEEYGEESNQFRVRVLGLPPKSEGDAVIPFELIEAARDREVEANPAAPVVWGLDPARSNDLVGLAKRQANILLEPIRTWPPFNDLMPLCGAVVDVWEQTPLRLRPKAIFVDAIGLGAGVADRLKELGLPARAVNISESPTLRHRTRYRNLKTELWFDARDWFAHRDSRIPPDPRLEQELSAQKYKPLTSSGMVITLPKADMRKYLHPRRSPDRADAFILTFAGQAAIASLGPQPDWSEDVKRHRKGIV